MHRYFILHYIFSIAESWQTYGDDANVTVSLAQLLASLAGKRDGASTYLEAPDHQQRVDVVQTHLLCQLVQVLRRQRAEDGGGGDAETQEKERAGEEEKEGRGRRLER